MERVTLGTLPTYLAADNLGGWLRARGYRVVCGQWVGGEFVVEVRDGRDNAPAEDDVLFQVQEENDAPALGQRCSS